MSSRKGTYIVIEGVDGAGKDTQEEFLKEILPADTVYTREPRGTQIGVVLRDVITGNELDPITEILLFYAARKELMNRVIIPALAEGKTVVSNRNELTTYAYQIHARERHDLEHLADYLSNTVLGEMQPDFCLFYDIPVEIRKERLEQRSDNINSFDHFDASFFERARDGYKEHIQKLPHAIIDASGTIEEVKEKSLQALGEFLRT